MKPTIPRRPAGVNQTDCGVPSLRPSSGPRVKPGVTFRGVQDDDWNPVTPATQLVTPGPGSSPGQA